MAAQDFRRDGGVGGGGEAEPRAGGIAKRGDFPAVVDDGRCADAGDDAGGTEFHGDGAVHHTAGSEGGEHGRGTAGTDLHEFGKPPLAGERGAEQPARLVRRADGREFGGERRDR